MLLAAPVWDYNASANRNFLPSDLILTIKLATNAKSYCISCTGIVSLEIAVELMQSLLASPVSAAANISWQLAHNGCTELRIVVWGVFEKLINVKTALCR